ncbi:hypothetical protein [Neobacillus sp. Marseille-QA0830]
MVQSEYQINRLDEEDVPGLVRLTTSVGWEYDEREFSTMLSAGTFYGHKNETSELISSAAIFPYGEELASIGMVIVKNIEVKNWPKRWFSNVSIRYQRIRRLC